MTKDIAEFDLDAFDAADTADMAVKLNGRSTTWIWSFAGPGHPQTVTQSNRLARERLQQERFKEQARVNGKKWSAPDDSVDEVRARNVEWVVERLVGWSPVKIGGETLAFSPDAARKLLSDPRKIDLLAQSMEFLAADDSFTKRSATA